jgi:RND family efflux transporter MFP subunit
VKIGHSIQRAAKLAVGPKHVLAKLIIALVIGLACMVTFWKPMHRVSAPFQFVAAQKRTLSAPYEGHLKGVYVKAGQRFKKGQLLAEMRTEDVQQQLYKAQADEKAYRQTATAKLAEAKNPSRTTSAIAEAEQARAQADGARADVLRFQHHLEQSKFVAPFDGIVLRGDLDDKLGAAVRPSDVLMEIEETGQPLKAELAVPERDVHFIAERPQDPAARDKTYGWSGKLATNSLPGEDIEFEIERIVPLGDAKEAENTFKVYAVLKQQPTFIRPGMAGEARIDAGHKRLVWIWTHRLVDFLRLKLWW